LAGGPEGAIVVTVSEKEKGENLMRISLRQTAGVGLVVGGVLDFIAGFLHPQGPDGNGSFHATIAAMLNDSKWPAAHWIGLVSFAVTAWAVWLLIDTGLTRLSVVAQMGARLFQVGLAVMIVEVAVEIAARPEAAAYAAGRTAPLVDLTQPLQTVGWPLLGLGLAVLALGLRVGVPRLVGVLGAIGGMAFAIGGVLTMGAHLAGAGPLFMFGAFTALWLVWTGVRLTARSQPDGPTSVPPRTRTDSERETVGATPASAAH
jgi:hypothetical protein